METLQIKSYLLITVQFLCTVFFFYIAGSAPLTLLPVIFISVGIAFAAWAILTMQLGNFRVYPVPKESARLVTKGPYRIMRHPMYAAVLLAMFGIAINSNTKLGYGVWIVLFTDLMIKMPFEEKFLLEKFPEYQDYMKRTKRLVPWIW